MRRKVSSANGIAEGIKLGNYHRPSYTRWCTSAVHQPYDRHIAQDVPARSLCSVPHTSVDEAVVGGALRDQIPAAHPLVGTFKLLHRIWSRLHVAQSGQVEIFRDQHGL